MKRPAIIEVTGLSIGYDDQVLQENANFEVLQGDVFAILGGSGCGKSTLMRYLVGLEETKQGAIHIAGLGQPTLEAGRPPFGVMFQSGALFGSMTVGENVGLALEEWTDLPHDAIHELQGAEAFFEVHRAVDLDRAGDRLEPRRSLLHAA